ncbi:hypothetical protein BD289DRAFT_449435 [Coniella lustricola]|uniref:F-box domain-containing protein n=1 Tax=Coniella lustricola TaxID=2025994 RepID=A0A2T3AMN5_9PEZI|nr:hypothetical protein BD289DRAFT_449435 [Coniella lustricola]
MATITQAPVEVLLRIAEYCDSQTLFALMQAKRSLYKSITTYQATICRENAIQHGFSRSNYFSSKKHNPGDQDRAMVPVPSFHLLTEIDTRLSRIDSLVQGPFLSTDSHSALRLTTRAMLDKFRAGLTAALLAADELSDLGLHVSTEAKRRDAAPTFRAWLVTQHLHGNGGHYRPISDMAMVPAHRDFVGLYDDSYYQTLELRDRQRSCIRKYSTRLLCWLLTLAEACARGARREQLASKDEDDPFCREMASKECVLRFGTCFLYNRPGASNHVVGSRRDGGGGGGGGSMWATDLALKWYSDCKTEFTLFEGTGGTVHSLGSRPGEDAGPIALPAGLHMSIMGELAERFLEDKRQTCDADTALYYEETWSSLHTRDNVHAMVGREVGYPLWRGYDGLDVAPPPKASGSFFM